MGLQVWLPLDGSLNNQGISSSAPIGSNVTVDNNGKIGKCYSFNGTSSSITVSNITIPTSNWSISAWVYPMGDSSSGHQYIVGLNTSSASDFTGVLCYYTNKFGVRTGGTTYTSSETSDLNAWYHVCATYGNSSLKLYVNGILVKTSSSPSAPVSASTVYIGMRGGKAGRYVGKLNDIRIYSHCLSEKEVKDIARGIVLHYPLDRNNLSPYTGNLILNGFGEFGTTNWATASKVATDDLPTADTTIKARFIANNNTLDYIPIYRNHNYSISLYVKASSTSGSCYPSLIPYDVDKLRINWHQCKGGFNLNTMTTLKQQLKAGDTKIYVNDLSAWSTAANWQNYAAIFGYKDSTGYTYPDGVYTRTTLAFWSNNTTEKTSLDKTNNIITLSSAYTGATIPAGQSICASSAGSVYYYPFGGIANSGIADWTYKSTTFSSETSYLSAAKYVQFSIYSSSSLGAGVTLKDITPGESHLEYDISGCQRNGTRNGNLTWTTDSPKYKASTYFNGTNTYIAAGTGAKVRDAITVNCWGYMDNWSTYAARMLSCTEGGGWNFEPSSSKMSFAVGTGESSNTYKNVAATSTLASLGSGWHMFTGTYDGFSSKIYIDGVLSNTNSAYTTKTPLFYNASNGIFIGAEAGGNTTTPAGSYFNGKMSDVRIYATALSAQDVKDLYNGLF